MKPRDELLEAIREIVAVQLGRAKPRSEDRLVEDLGAESADLVNLAAAVDDRFGVFIDEETLASVSTVADLEAKVARLLEEDNGSG